MSYKLLAIFFYFGIILIQAEDNNSCPVNKSEKIQDLIFHCENEFLYFIDTKEVNSDEATKLCQHLSIDQLSIESQNEQNSIEKLMKKYNIKKIWLSATNSKNPSIFTWSNGNIINENSYRNWHFLSPNNIPNSQLHIKKEDDYTWVDGPLTSPVKYSTVCKSHLSMIKSNFMKLATISVEPKLEKNLESELSEPGDSPEITSSSTITNISYVLLIDLIILINFIL